MRKNEFLKLVEQGEALNLQNLELGKLPEIMVNETFKKIRIKYKPGVNESVLSPYVKELIAAVSAVKDSLSEAEALRIADEIRLKLDKNLGGEEDRAA